MSRILLYGLCPLPFENTTRVFGPGLRSWQFARGLADAGHEVRLRALKMGAGYDGAAAAGKEEREGVQIERIEDAEYFDRSSLERGVRSHRPDALVGATIYGSFALARGSVELPLWADQFGHVMAEAQAKAAREGSNRSLSYFWRMERAVLLRSDRISVVSERQKYAAIGELGTVGRLTAETCGYEFISVIPCAVMPALSAESRPVVRGVAVPSDAFLVLWSGGYNVWSDIATLVDALEIAMRENPRIHFVSTGGEIPGHDARTYSEMQRRVSSSSFRERFHLEGWVPTREVPFYVAEADLGVLTDRPIYEGLLGDKNRITQWMGAGLPVAYNRIGDLGERLEKDLALTFDVGDAEGLARQILWAAGNASELRRMAERARQYAARHLSFADTTRELARWAGSPVFAPDASVRRGVSSPFDHGGALARFGLTAAAERMRYSRVLGGTWRAAFRLLRGAGKKPRASKLS